MIVGMWSLQKNYLPLIEWKDWDLWFIIELLQECISYHISKLCCKIYSCDFCHTSDQIFIFLSFCNLIQFTSQSISYLSTSSLSLSEVVDTITNKHFVWDNRSIMTSKQFSLKTTKTRKRQWTSFLLL